MRKYLVYIMVVTLFSCAKDKYYSPDADNPGLLPDKGDYLDKDYGTQALAAEMAGVFSSEIGMVYYDAETRTIPQLYLTRGAKDIHATALSSGAIEISFEKFNTEFMPLQLSVKIKALIEVSGDTLLLRGTDGVVRTGSDDGPIGQPLPESDDAELTGMYIRSKKELRVLIDLMLPIPVKATVSGKK
ncbi:MAG: hypothetical protein KF862_14860 [Chitinophagaceae bacterium]|nr:hypothetical protein [Chitinophagaceae bacterium]